MMMSLWRNLMIRRGMVPRIEGMRIYFLNNQAPGFSYALAVSSNITLNRTTKIMRIFGGPVSFTLGLLAAFVHLRR